MTFKLSLVFVSSLLFVFCHFGRCDRRIERETEEHHHVFSNSWAVEIKSGHDVAEQIASKHGFINKGLVGTLDDIYHFVHQESPLRERRSASSLHPKHHHLVAEEQVGFVEQQIVKSRHKRDHTFYYSSPSDHMWSEQWYLHRDSGHHMNVELAWEQDIIGRGAVVSILDDGIEHTHPDLKNNYDPEASYDFNDDDNDPFPRYDPSNENKHGTRCAGEVAANRDGNCGTGAAYGTKVGGVRMLDGDVTDVVEAGSLSLKPEHIDIYSSSWGPSDDGTTVDGPGNLAKKAFLNGVTKGRDGLGSIFVWAAGNGGRNGDSCNCDGYAVSPYTISVGAASEKDKKPWYLEYCSSTLTSTYSSGDGGELQIVSTDLHGRCTNHHTGTSASAPLAAGILALALEANFNLTWRDMQYLAVYSSNPSYPQDDNWHTNGAGLRVSHLYGFGILDAAMLVNRARNWISVPPADYCTLNVTSQFKGSQQTKSGQPLTVTVHTDGCGLRYLEHVQAVTTLSMLKKYRGSVSISLTSPSGTVSTLLPYRRSDFHHDGFHKWPFMTVHSWGENPTGDWTFTIKTVGGAVVELDALDLVFYGTKNVPASVQAFPNDCHEQCDGMCAREGARYCDKCKNVRIASTLECVQSCPVGTFQNNHMCRQCPELCAECNKHVCTRCRGSAVRLMNGSCTETCPGLTYLSTDRTCVPCHPSCLSCNGPGETDCLACPHQLILTENGTCSIRQPSSCSDGTYFDHRTLTCRSCHTSCKKCSGKNRNKCTQCHNRYTLGSDGKCYDSRQLRTSCDSGTFYNTTLSACISCPSMCANCTEHAGCTSCMDNFYLLSNGNCVRYCPDHTVTDNATGVCLDTACHNSCLTCFGPKDTQCISCNDELIMFNNSCFETCPRGSYKEIKATTCKQCQKNCTECVETADNCTSCVHGTFLSLNQCVKTCPAGTFGNLDSGTCHSCPSNCDTCLSEDTCKVCSTNYLLVTTSGECVAKCPPGFATMSSLNACYPCLDNCKECVHPDECQKCADNFTYYRPNHSCLHHCPEGYFANAVGICLACEAPCSTCTISSTNCTKCGGKTVMNHETNTCDKCCNADIGVNVSCCNCDANDEVCVKIIFIPHTIEIGDDPRHTKRYYMFTSVLIIALILLLVVFSLIAIAFGVRYIRKRSNVVPMQVPQLIPAIKKYGTSQKYHKLPSSEFGLEVIPADSESECDIFVAKTSLSPI